MALLAVGLVLLARAPLPNTYLLDLLPASLLVALGLPAAFAGTNIAAVTAVEQADTGLASGLVNTMQRIGSGIGIALLSALFAVRVALLGLFITYSIDSSMRGRRESARSYPLQRDERKRELSGSRYRSPAFQCVQVRGRP